MSIKAKLVHTDESDIRDAETAGPINLLARSLLSQVDITLQAKFIASSAGHYSYKVMNQTLLNYGSDAKTSQLAAQMFYKDNNIDDFDPKTDKNKGHINRSQLFAGSKVVHMIAPIAHDLFKLDTYLLNQVGMS